MSNLPKAATTDFTSTTLNGTIGSTETSITVNNGTNIQYPCYLVIDREDASGTATPNAREVVKCTNKSGNILTVTRGVNNSTARSHNDSALVEPMLTVGFWDDFYDTYDEEHTPSDGVHDLTKVVVLSGASVQTMTNKILSNPTITNPNISQMTIYYSVFNNATILSSNLASIIFSNATIEYSNLSSVYISGGTIVNPTLAGAGGTDAGQMGFSTTNKSLLSGDGTTNHSIDIGPWITYQPTIVASGHIGNGSIYGAYQRIGTNVHYCMTMIHGTTSSVASGFRISLPIADDYYGTMYIGSGVGLWRSTTFTGGVKYNAADVQIMALEGDETYAYYVPIEAGVPATWADGDYIYFDIYYPTDLP